MKLERIAQAALLALVVTACTGGDEQVSPSADQIIAPSSTVVQQIDTTTTTSAAVATTAAPSTSSAPESLAFASSKDIGRIFEADGATNALVTPGGDLSSSLIDGQLVQATSARNYEDTLWVQVRSATGDQQRLGWVPGDDIRPTSQIVTTDNAELSRELRIARRSSNPVRIVRTPGGDDQVAVLESQEIAMHGGSSALAPSGDVWLDVIDSASGDRIGWVPSASFTSVRTNFAKSADHTDARPRPDSTITYGATLSSGIVTTNGCNASQITFTNPSSTLGLALVLGQQTPVGRVRSGIETWSASGGAKVFIEPGDTAVFTFITDQPRSWYFARLDEDFRADAARSADGSLNVVAGGTAQATNVQEIQLPGGSCVYVARVDPDDPDTYGYDADGEAPAVIPDKVVEDESVNAEPDADETSTDETPVDGE